MDIAYDGTWGYHPLVVSLANTAGAAVPGQPQRQPPLARAGRQLHRPGRSRLCREAGFRSLLLRGDTDFTQTKHLDRWDDAGDVRFLFGIDADAQPRRPGRAAAGGGLQLPGAAGRAPIKTVPRQRPERHKAAIVRERGFETIHTLEEMVAEFAYRPMACDRDYRVVVLRKRLATEKGQLRLFEEYRYFFFITNDRDDAGRSGRA